MSRNIEAVIGEPSAVRRPLMRWKNGPPGSWPAALATALHSSRMPSRKSRPPGAATITPTGARIRLVDAAIERLAAQQHDIELVLDGIGLHGRRILERDVAVRALDDEAGGRQLARALRPDQESDVAAGLQHPSAEIATDSAGADHENTHV